LRILYPRRLVHIRGLNNFLTSALELPEYDFILCGQPFDEELEKEQRKKAELRRAAKLEKKGKKKEEEQQDQEIKTERQ
ncbi:MAG: hypothetical protein N3A54_05495, partial [Patescibacteria group bacterium]|nr:hypothetical protein [Patescibacteria group bacterium]